MIAELTAGAKRSHWMWFVFPELAGLGSMTWTALSAGASAPSSEAPLLHRQMIDILVRLQADWVVKS